MEIETKEIEITLRVRVKTVRWQCSWDWRRLNPQTDRKIIDAPVAGPKIGSSSNWGNPWKFSG